MSLRRSLGIPDGAPIIAMMSRLIPLEGIEDFIDAAALVSWHRPDARFLILDESGDSTSYTQSILGRIRRLGLRDRVLIRPKQIDLPALLAETTVSVTPSRRGTTAALVQAATAAGVPVIATRVGEVAKVVRHGVTGLLVPPGDPQDLADAIGQILDYGWTSPLRIA